MSASWSLEPGALVAAGELRPGGLGPAAGGPSEAALGALLQRAGTGWVDLDFALLDVDDGVAMAELVAWLRALQAAALGAGAQGLRLREAPQMVAHTLYKVGALRDGRLILEDPRSDEGRWGP